MGLSPDYEDWVARARERDLLESATRLGATLKRLGREWIGPCPACGGTDRFSINPVKNVFNCRGARGGDVIAMVEHVAGLKFAAAVEWLTGEAPPHGRSEIDEKARAANEARRLAAQRKAELRERAENRYQEAMRSQAYRIWTAGLPFAGSPAENYLRHRGIDYEIQHKPPIRFVTALPYPEEGVPIEQWPRHPALVCAVTGADGRFRGIWRIYLAPDGRGKAAVPEAKLGLGPCVGGAVWLGPATVTVNVCEGLETGFGVLGLTRQRESVAVTLSTSGMVNFEEKSGTTMVRIWPDGDRDRYKRLAYGVERYLPSPGMRAADQLRDRLLQAGRLAMVQPTPKRGQDYLDIYTAMRRVDGSQSASV